MNWIVIRSHPHREQQATEHLVRQGFQTYCPVIRKTVRHARRATTTLRPLFPGYLFVEAIVDSAAWWRPIASTVGVRAIVRNGEAPAVLDAGAIQALRAREVDGVITRPANPICVGQSVRLSSGAFDGFAAKVIELSERDRVTVLLAFVNQHVKATVTLDKISPI